MSFAFNLVKLNNVLLAGVRDGKYDRRDKFAPIGTDATLHETGNAVIRCAPMAGFTTIAVRSLFASIVAGGITQLPALALDGVNGIDLIAAKLSTTGPGYQAGTTANRRRFNAGMLALSGISWRPGDVVTATAEAYATAAAGGTDPIITTQIAVPTLPFNQEQLVLSSLTIGGATPTEVTSLDVAITHQIENNDEEICYNTGLPYPVLLKQAGVGGYTHIEATLETLDLDLAPSASGTLVAVFTRLNHLGVGLGSQTATLTLNSGLIREESIAGTPGKRRFVVPATFDGTNFPITLATA